MSEDEMHVEYELRSDISRLFEDPQNVRRIMNRAIRVAIIDHKRTGDPVCEWRNGEVVWIAPEDIQMTDEKSESLSISADSLSPK